MNIRQDVMNRPHVGVIGDIAGKLVVDVAIVSILLTFTVRT